MELIDVHAHLMAKHFDDIEATVNRAKEAGLVKIITAGVDFSSSQEAVQVAEKYENVFACVGIHPENIEEFDENSLKNAVESIKNLAKNEKVVAIGEIGLDYFYLQGKTEEEILNNKKIQKLAFIMQIELANELNLPIVVHSRDAMGDTLEILREHPIKQESLLHCYSGSIESARELMKLGFSFSFGGVVTFKNAKNAVNVVEELPLERILLETDCPYMSPEPFRGKRNEPKNVAYVADKIAWIKGISMEEVARVTTENAKRIFKFIEY